MAVITGLEFNNLSKTSLAGQFASFAGKEVRITAIGHADEVINLCHRLATLVLSPWGAWRFETITGTMPEGAKHAYDSDMEFEIVARTKI